MALTKSYTTKDTATHPDCYAMFGGITELCRIQKKATITVYFYVSSDARGVDITAGMTCEPKYYVIAGDDYDYIFDCDNCSPEGKNFMERFYSWLKTTSPDATTGVNWSTWTDV